MNSAPISTTAPFGSSRDHTRPPTRSRASSTTTSAPARANASAAASPANPAPTTATRTRSSPSPGDDQGVHGHAPVAQGDHRVDVEGLDPVAEILGQPGDRHDGRRYRAEVGRRAAPRPEQEPPDGQPVEHGQGPSLVEGRQAEPPVGQGL